MLLVPSLDLLTDWAWSGVLASLCERRRLFHQSKQLGTLSCMDDSVPFQASEPDRPISSFQIRDDNGFTYASHEVSGRTLECLLLSCLSPYLPTHDDTLFEVNHLWMDFSIQGCLL